MRSFKEIKQQYRSSLKSMDTEETIDLMFYRPIGYAWALLFAKLGVTPNVVTIISIILGVAGGVLLYFGASPLIWLNYVGILLIIWANSYDSADGQLARMTGQYSRLGRILDGVSGDLWFIAIYFALTFRELHFGDSALGTFFCEHGWVIWTLAIVAGASHAFQAAMADYYRQFHLYFLKGKDGSELDSVAALNADYRKISWSEQPLKKLTMFFYRNYTANQERFTPQMQRLRGKLKEEYGDDIPQEFRDKFRAKSKPLMKYTNMLSFNTRTIAMFLAVIVKMPWLYFVFEIVVLNAMLVYMICSHEHRCKSLIKSNFQS
ncbi:MAG: CDP-alcohol phosphatidyltransferase family protein [Muribaculaceae bacterium]|nr:CDP-alcohol phosphatidyltransferase family protein [Muribaculaceae bacterium]